MTDGDSHPVEPRARGDGDRAGGLPLTARARPGGTAKKPSGGNEASGELVFGGIRPGHGARPAEEIELAKDPRSLRSFNRLLAGIGRRGSSRGSSSCSALSLAMLGVAWLLKRPSVFDKPLGPAFFVEARSVLVIARGGGFSTPYRAFKARESRRRRPTWRSSRRREIQGPTSDGTGGIKVSTHPPGRTRPEPWQRPAGLRHPPRHSLGPLRSGATSSSSGTSSRESVDALRTRWIQVTGPSAGQDFGEHRDRAGPVGGRRRRVS